LADALLLCCSGRCFAALSLVEFSSDGCFAVVVGRSGACFATLIVLLIFAPLAVQFLLAGPVVGWR